MTAEDPHLIIPLQNTAQTIAAEILDTRTASRSKVHGRDSDSHRDIYVMYTTRLGETEGKLRAGLFTDLDDTPELARRMVDVLDPLEIEDNIKQVDGDTLVTFFNAIVELCAEDEDFASCITGGMTFLDHLKAGNPTEKDVIALTQFSRMLEAQLPLGKLAKPLNNIQSGSLGITTNGQMWQMIHLLWGNTEYQSPKRLGLEKFGYKLRALRRGNEKISSNGNEQLLKIENVLMWDMGEEDEISEA